MRRKFGGGEEIDENLKPFDWYSEKSNGFAYEYYSHQLLTLIQQGQSIESIEEFVNELETIRG